MEDNYRGMRGVYYRRALREFNEKGGYKGVIRILGMIAELEDLLDIHKRLLHKKEKKDGQERKG